MLICIYTHRFPKNKHFDEEAIKLFICNIIINFEVKNRVE